MLEEILRKLSTIFDNEFKDDDYVNYSIRQYNERGIDIIIAEVICNNVNGTIMMRVNCVLGENKVDVATCIILFEEKAPIQDNLSVDDAFDFDRLEKVIKAFKHHAKLESK